MTKCSPACMDACDFCKWYQSNEEIVGGWTSYTDNGFCEKHEQKKEPYETCDDFFCFRVKGQE